MATIATIQKQSTVGEDPRQLLLVNSGSIKMRLLISPLSASTTGTALAVDGGMHGLRPRGPVRN